MQMYNATISTFEIYIFLETLLRYGLNLKYSNIFKLFFISLNFSINYFWMPFAQNVCKIYILELITNNSCTKGWEIINRKVDR